MKKFQKIVVIGAGNMATQIAIAFKESGCDVIEVFNRNERTGKELAKKISAKYIPAIHLISRDADLYIIAVKDDAITTLAKKIKLKNKVVVHTSGSVQMNVLNKCSSNFGVLYPLQTFSKTRRANFREIPLCIEANNAVAKKIIASYAGKISGKVIGISSEQRSILHLAAVFAGNFSNHLYAIASVILKKHRLSFSLLKPLLTEITQKAVEGSDPGKMQTGPAARGEKKIIRKHLRMLKENKDLKKIYKLLSDNISTFK